MGGNRGVHWSGGSPQGEPPQGEILEGRCPTDYKQQGNNRNLKKIILTYLSKITLQYLF